ncbi:MAG TPA: aminotransferase class III-fold pyridoxal phosphate-dependent enzyme, partial [Candidatus Methylacidiphilales bacterium]
HASYLGLAHGPGARLGAALCKAMDFDDGRVFYSDDGSTAIEAALKIVFQYFRQNGEAERTTFLSLGGGYHGDTVGAMSAGQSASFHETFGPLLFKNETIASPGCYRCPYNRAQPERADARTYRKCNWECVAEAGRKIAAVGPRAAALVIEPRVQGAAGMVMHPHGYLERVAPLVREAGAKLIADEVLTGFGRTGTMLASMAEGVRPDLVAVAKGMTGGMLPMGATLVREGIVGGFRGAAHGKSNFERTFFHGHSYTGNPLGCAAALANLEVFEEEKTFDRIADHGAVLEREAQAFWELPRTGDVRREGMILAVELVRDRATKEPFAPEERVAYQIGEIARRKGLLARGLNGTLFLLPPYGASRAEVVRMVRLLREAAEEFFHTK